MARIKTTRDLNAGNIEKETWNRQDHILRFLSAAQSYITWGDMNNDLEQMYQGCQMMLDTLAPDFEEKKTEKETTPEGEQKEKKIVLKGIKTSKFATYRTLLDQAQTLNIKSKNYNNYQPEVRVAMRNSAYKKLQELKYSLLQECERLGYNAKRTNTAEAYRTGNN